jgi:L-2-hydroxycarboxylate dehydrogenase (NAD+)
METVRIERANLENFCAKAFARLGLSEGDSLSAASVLVAADARGIPSHGVGRLRRYLNGLRTGAMLGDAKPAILMDTPVSLVVDAKGGMGAPVSVATMKTVIEKAEKAGAAFASVRDSNHNGIMGYYAMMALPKSMIGIAMTNTAALGVPTYGRLSMFGTNPLAFAAPADKERSFVLDMSTTVVTRGKIEVYERLDKELPHGWAVDRHGRPAKDAGTLLQDMLENAGGGILPLGGLGTGEGGHKGYALAIMVDILCALLSSSAFGPAVHDTKETSARVSHFFGAVKIENFRDPAEFRKDMDRMLADLRSSPPAEGEESVYYAGLREALAEEECSRTGVPLILKSYDGLVEVAKELGLERPVLIEGK